MKSWIIYISTLFFITGICYAQESDTVKNYIYWSDDYRLVWTDFDELPERYSEHAAFSVVGYESRFDMNNARYKAVIKTYFDRNESWSKNWISILLTHEQGHFDLAELHGRKFRKRVKEAMEAHEISVEKFRLMSDQAIKLLEEAQKEYDEATNYSIDFKAQKEWIERIHQELKQMEKFANPEVVVSRIN